MARTPPTNSPRLALARQTRVLADVDADADVVALAARPRAPSSRPSTPRRPSISRVHARATTSRALLSSQRRPRARSHVPTPFAARRRRPARAGVAPRVVPVVPARVPARISPRAPPRVRARPFASITRPIASLARDLPRVRTRARPSLGAALSESGRISSPSTPSSRDATSRSIRDALETDARVRRPRSTMPSTTARALPTRLLRARRHGRERARRESWSTCGPSFTV